MHYEVVIIGGGAAGLMCAAVAGQRGRRVLVLEHANRVGKKVLMSGGGRCNFTNLHTTAANYLSANPHFCKSALARYKPADFIALVDRHDIAWHEKERGQLFCDDSSKQIVRLLLDECAQGGVRVEVSCAVQGVAQQGNGFVLETALGRVQADALVIATGGLSIPSMGASGFGYQLARQFGHSVLPTRAGLVPLTLSGTHLEHYAPLSGLSTPAVLSCGKQRFEGGLLFTHRGISGPAVLQISSYWQAKDELQVDWLPQFETLEFLQVQQAAHPQAELRTALSLLLPARLAQTLCALKLGSKPLRQYRGRELQQIAAQLQAWPITASGSEGYRTAEVTLGGVDTRELSSSSMASQRVENLYFIGEVMDVTGHLGGFNFQWAWASAQAAGRVV